MSSYKYKVVLSDKLFSIYKKSAGGVILSPKERKAYELLISNLEFEILTNLAQLNRCRIHHSLPDEVYYDLQPALLSDEENIKLSLVELSDKTIFKLIITQDSNNVEPPYFNIKDSKINKNYMITNLHNENREYLGLYLKQLLKNSNEIFIHDKYFPYSEDNAKLFDLLPNKAVNIKYIENGDSSMGDFIGKCCAKNNTWTTSCCDTTKEEYNRFARSHDRYLIIDNKIEITITSGFMYLWDEGKEVTSIFKEFKI